MEDKHREILRKYRDAFLKDLEPLKVINRLDFLDDDDRDQVKAQKTRSKQAEELLDMLPRKGPDAFHGFITALYSGSQKFLARPLIKASGMEESHFSKDDEVGMTTEHKKVLRTSCNQLSSISIEKLVPLLRKLLDERDKQELQNTRKPSYDRVQMLLTEILPKKGPEAFQCFVEALKRIDPPKAEQLLIISEMKGSSNGEESLTSTVPVQESSSNYTLASPVQDVLDDQHKLLEEFCARMDKEVLGNGWKRLCKELGLPDEAESFVEKECGSPTFSVIRGWISYNGRSATIQALLDAVNRSQRKDCVAYLLKPLNLNGDVVDSPVTDLTKKFDRLSPGPREVKCFGDLTFQEASYITDKLGPSSWELLKSELEKEPKLSGKTLPGMMTQSKNYSIRRYTNLITGGERPSVIKLFREVLPTQKGVIGPLLSPDTFVRDIRYSCRRNLTRNLCADDSWKALAEKLGMDNTTIQYLDNRRVENPADEVLRHWEVKALSTVGTLYDILVDLERPLIADLL